MYTFVRDNFTVIVEGNRGSLSFPVVNLEAVTDALSILSLDLNTTITREDTNGSLPRELVFTDDSLVSVILYSILFAIAAVGNLSVFVTLFRYRHRNSRVNLYIMHLCTADLIVTFVMLPMEIGWHITVSWTAGDIGCRLLMFFRAFGFYLSSFILITISLDRYFAVIHPLSLTDGSRRGKLMLIIAWLCGIIASAPQSVIFHEEMHPDHPWYYQCVTFNFFPSDQHELAYNIFNFVMLYGAPLVVIVVCYTLILIEISRKTTQSQRQLNGKRVHFAGNGGLRRSGIGRIVKARTRTLKMTIVIVVVFIMCWTPYYVIIAWWWCDEESAKMIPLKIQRGLFIFAVSNSCMNPIVYGMFTTVFQKEFKRYFSWLLCCTKRSRNIPIMKTRDTPVQRLHYRPPVYRYRKQDAHRKESIQLKLV